MKLFMSLGMDVNPLRVVLDTNILISAIHFGGKPRMILNLVEESNSTIKAIASPVLLAELGETFAKKFNFDQGHVEEIKSTIEDGFELVYPKKELDVVRDRDDNRVLEAAVEGNCEYIITGDKDLLRLKVYRSIKIVTPQQFLENFKN